MSPEQEALSDSTTSWGSSPDLELWRRMAYWTPEEAVALALGMDPREFNASTLADESKDQELVKNFFDWLELLGRAIAIGHLNEKCEPEAFLDWLSALGLAGEFEFDESDSNLLSLTTQTVRRLQPINYRASYEGLEVQFRSIQQKLTQAEEELAELHDYTEYLEHERNEASSVSSEKPAYRKLDERKRKTHLKIILAISIEKYRYDPRKSKNTAPGRIQNATQLSGFEVSDETIRNVLAEAMGEFPEVLTFFEDE